MAAIRDIFFLCLVSITVLAIPVPNREIECVILRKRPQVTNNPDFQSLPVVEVSIRDASEKTLKKRPTIVVEPLPRGRDVKRSPHVANIKYTPGVEVSEVLERALKKRPTIIVDPTSESSTYEKDTRKLIKRPQVINDADFKSLPVELSVREVLERASPMFERGTEDMNPMYIRTLKKRPTIIVEPTSESGTNEKDTRKLMKRPQVTNNPIIKSSPDVKVSREASEGAIPLVERGANDKDERSLVKRPQIINNPNSDSPCAACL